MTCADYVYGYWGESLTFCSLSPNGSTDSYIDLTTQKRCPMDAAMHLYGMSSRNFTQWTFVTTYQCRGNLNQWQRIAVQKATKNNAELLFIQGFRKIDMGRVCIPLNPRSIRLQRNCTAAWWRTQWPLEIDFVPESHIWSTVITYT